MRIILAFIVAAKAELIPCPTCIKFDGVCYISSFLFNLQAPFSKQVDITKMGLVKSGQKLYYAFKSLLDDEDNTKIGFVDINTHQPESFGLVHGDKDIYNFRTFTFNKGNEIRIFAGGSGGIYEVINGNVAKLFTAVQGPILTIFYKDDTLYFVRENENKIVEKKGDQLKVYENYRNVKNFVVARNNVLVYVSDTGLYAAKLGTDLIVRLTPQTSVRGLEVDSYGIVYAWWLTNVVKVVIDNDFIFSRLIVAANLSCGSLTFDKFNDVLYNSAQKLYKLTRTDVTISC